MQQTQLLNSSLPPPPKNPIEPEIPEKTNIGKVTILTLFQATVESNIDRFNHILYNDLPKNLSKKEVLDIKDSEGRRLIHIAAFYGALDILDKLIALTVKHRMMLNY